MRTVLIAATLLAGAGTAQAGQRMVMQGPGTAPAAMGGGAMAPRPAPMNGGPGMGPRAAGMQRGPGGFGRGGQGGGGRHWGGQYQGHWVGGMRAPGGWGGYRQPYRGYGLPGYWISPGFQIGDWGDYGLYQPPVGYTWSRYYDDAVLIDNRGSVYDTIGGIDWDSYDLDGAADGQGDGYYATADGYRGPAGAGYAYPPQGGYDGGQPGGYAPQGYPQPGYAPQGGEYPERHRSNGVGGALVGGAAGGIAGGLIAGRHDKVAGALIGAGVGAAAGYAIDRNAHRHRDYPPVGGPGADYPAPEAGYAPGPGYGPGYPQPAVIQGGGTLVTTSTVGGGYYTGGTVTTVTVASAPVVTTTTEVFEDSVTYTRRAARKTYRKHVWHRPVCYCR